MLDARLDELSQRENSLFLRAPAGQSDFPDGCARRTKWCCRRSWPNRRRSAVASTHSRQSTSASRAMGSPKASWRARRKPRRPQLRAPRRPRVLTRESEEPRRASTAQLPAGRSAADDLAGARVPPPFHAGRDAGRANRLARDWFPDQNRVVIVSAPDAAPCRHSRPGGAGKVVERRRGEAVEAYVDAGAGQALMEAPPRAHDREDDDAAGGRHHRVDAVERRHGVVAQADDVS